MSLFVGHNLRNYNSTDFNDIRCRKSLDLEEGLRVVKRGYQVIEIVDEIPNS